ncbi:hypothetical protein EYC98_19910 [Halieaceae bacterium IMCC14734]|uniref:Uncharacterized protein n=1 Tax=Candidatus Litorirhabdus singularis TaxID=2518993 RepID=A0ABT3TM78_9GAMM|nr:transmembrane 220 family protein [Candidatus Litorirhabdus singularis]MCX2983134.1 hypothetical protein [Candidatus Litorirhabdus singularis]
MLKYPHIISAIMFLAMAVIQLNDSDPLYWVSVYLTIAVVAGASYFGSHLEVLSKVAIGMVVAGLLISAPGVMDYFAAEDYASIFGRMTVEKRYIESAREFGGLLISAVYLTYFEVSASASN